MTQFAQIPTDLICRFGELSKTEIRVVGYLYAARNKKTGQCNPSRARIAKETRVAPPHVSAATRSLESKGWIFETPDGNFILLDEPDNVTESVTKDDGIGNKDMTESVTNVTESVTKSDGIGHSTPYSSFEQTKNIQGTEKSPDAVAIYFETFPGQNINIWQQELIIDRVSDFNRWRAALTQWRANNWVARNVGNILDYYDKLTDREKKYGPAQKSLTAAERNWERTVANEQLGDQLRSGELDALLDELHRRDPLYRHEVAPPSKPPAALTGGFGDHGEGLG